MNNFIRIINKTGFWARRKSPEILVATAIIAAAGSIILAVRATPKAEAILAKANAHIKQIKEDMTDSESISDDKNLVNLSRKELAKTYAKTVFELGKVYLPSAIGFGLTVGSILGSHKIMKGRNMALAAAYTTLENGYRSYRSRVSNEIGSGLEKDIFRNVYSEDKEKTEKDENGNDIPTMNRVTGPHVKIDSDFTALYDNTSYGWTRDANLNLNNLALIEKQLNMRLQYYGAVFLHEVYEAIGIDISTLGDRKNQASRVLGWIYDTSDDSRDNYISFGLFDQHGNKNEYAMGVLRNNDQEIFLEFNVDGDILTGDGGKKTFTKYRKVM